MLEFLMFVALGAALGAGFRATALLAVSALALIGVFAVTALGGAGAAAAAFDALIAVLGLQAGYAAAAVGRELVAGRLRGEKITAGAAAMPEAGTALAPRRAPSPAGPAEPILPSVSGALTAADEMSERIASFDWSATPLGPPEQWSTTLRTVLNVLLKTRTPMYVAWGDSLTLLYNDGYAEILGDKHPAALGRPLPDVWPEAWHMIGPEVERALAGGSAFERDRPRTLRRRGGAQEIAYFSYSTVPLHDDAGRIRGVFCTCQETTAEVKTREADKAEIGRLRELFRQAPGFMAVFRGPEHVIEIVNRAYVDLVGDPQLLGKTVREAFPEFGETGFEVLDQVYATGTPRLGTRTPVMLSRSPDGSAEERIIDYVLQPIRDAADRVSGIFVQGQDVTDAARADERIREADRLARSTIDTLRDLVAVIDAEGNILTVNEAWRAFAAANPAGIAAIPESANYLAVCDEAAAHGDGDAARVAALTRRVASGSIQRAEWEYSLNGPGDLRWFSLKISRFGGDGPVRVVLASEDITARKKNESRIEYLATHDALTGLPNRNLLEDRARQSIEHAQRTGLGLALLCVDLDNIRHLNDAYSHAIGDAVINACAQRIAAVLRPGDTAARLGSDEFVVVLNDLVDVSTDAARMSRTIVETISSPLSFGEHEFTVTPTIGISLFPADGRGLEELLRNADTAMYRAKSIGRGGYQFYSPEMSARANERILLEGELRRALRLDQFELHYQPQVGIATGAPVGIEALVRWQHPQLGWLQPGRFISIAEETGLIGQIGRFVLREACRQNRAWQREGLPAMPIAVNIAAAQLRHPDFVDTVEDILAETGLDPRHLELEITEGTMMEMTEALLARIDRLKRLGIRLSIDDFGTGYSNLAYLQTFPLDRLKIDRSFIGGAPADEGSVSIVRAILGLGESLGIEVIAEGVETAEQAKLLENLGCDQAQGFFYARPMPAPAARDWLFARLPAERRRGAGFKAVR